MALLEKWKVEASERLRRAWIRGVVAGLDEVDEETARKVLKRCGEACARSWLDSYSYDPASHGLDSWIKLVNELDPGVRNVKRENDTVLYELKHGRCVCPLVSENLVDLTPKLCSACTTNFYGYIFKKAAKRPVSAELVESLATGSDKCVFRIRLQSGNLCRNVHRTEGKKGSEAQQKDVK